MRGLSDQWPRAGSFLSELIHLGILGFDSIFIRA